MRDQEFRLRVPNPTGSQKLHDAIVWMISWRPPGGADTPRAPLKEEEVYMPSQAMIADGLDRVLGGGDLSSLDPRLVHFLIPPLRDMKQRALDAGDYGAAQRADQGQRNVHNQEAFQATVELQDERTHEDSERADVAYIQLQNIREKWELVLQQKQFGEPPPPSRAKLSPQCLDLRFKEKHLSRSKRFAEASAMKKLADAMEEKEMRQRREEWIRDLTIERQKMIDREK
jgi:hypothetical protein